MGSLTKIDHITYPNGQVVQYGYYSSGPSNERLESITNEAPATGGTISQFSYGYNAAGDITSWTQQSGTNAAISYGYGYDGARELLSAVKTSSTAAVALDAYAYRYDNAGNRLGQQINYNTVTSAIYNNLNQVTSVSGTGLLSLSGSLSEPGTVTVAGAVVSTDTYNNFTITAPVVAGSNTIPITATATGTSGLVTNKTLGINVTSGTPIPQLTYDANGNLTNAGTPRYVYDAANRLVQIWYGTVGSSANTTMSYDGLGRRVQIIETSSSGSVISTKNLIWDGMTIREERNASNAVTKMYFSNAVQIGGSNCYYTRDHLGSVRELTDTNAVVQARYDYDPYGQQTQVSGTMVADFGYTGFYYHQPSGLDLAPYREYLPSLGRWGSRDPIDSIAYTQDAIRGSYGTASLSNVEVNQGPNIYEYVFNDPLGLIDPSGLGPVGPGGAAMGNAAKCCKPPKRYTTWGASAYGSVDACVTALMNQNGLPPNLNRCGGAAGLLGGLARGWGAGSCTYPFIAVGTGVGAFNLGLWMSAEAICNQTGCWGPNGAP